MSFSSNAKTELLETWPKRRCCKVAEAYGLLLFSHKKASLLTFQTDKEVLYKRFRSLYKQISHAEPQYTETENVFTAQLPEPLYSGDLFSCDACRAAFLRGAFLVCGTISNPDKEYHLEFVSKNEESAWKLCVVLKEIGLDSKMTGRKGSFVTYLKESENIEDLMTFMGAPNASLEIMNVKILKDFRNNVNRVTNFETANIEKTAKASAKHLEAIRVLEEKGMLEPLPKELYEAAVARRDHFDLSLGELGDLLGLSRSGIHHRLAKLAAYAEEVEKS